MPKHMMKAKDMTMEMRRAPMAAKTIAAGSKRMKKRKKQMRTIAHGDR